ncbi:sensory transduction histidine kinase,Sensor histidine kinase YycG,hybrid sensory histidine kinase BarA,Predicted periplasmic ligand-binding sensor domain,phosphate regulon sensor kinase PhoR,Histidine kinase-, DNA gyrase B-, and HSP90-like ATPase [[Clostridium] sordellii]|uniref:sensor histidine kinase n=1 Tax=Paraclostridium sordellii TaxID=1505 RepID=UPI0005441464|nr:HAMP domain-containing sensor histidine kinase [Paeniclostridium sordellii]CEK34629.1 sensory transduction histidine kinase,Sensor histidine kinase YycG,hybrid sensory histidine kinase BarA,Predicted periplasmic ligand-binding sensor domain,phosphate regulon sensor kinase PhoR,Histidine kinase-, DNA gyrase B-, and HSP90-like ATPase [[Clostridium] sordellii] [Paeniclostridium sordellii]
MKKRGYTIENLEELLDNLPYEIWLKNKEGKHIYINKLGAENIGLSKEDIIGKTDHELRPKCMADKCLETDRDLIEGRIDRYSKEEGCNNFNGVSYNVNKFILNKDEEIILGGIAEEISLNKSIQEITEHIMVDSSNFNDLKTKYNIFLKDKLKSLNLVLNSINIDIFLYGEDRTFNFYMSADDSICIFNNNSKIILNDDFKKKFLNENKYFHTSKYKEFIELNNNYKDGLISKMYAIEVADNIYTLINIQYINEESIKYKDHVSITEILKKISILILQLENENNAYAPDIGIEEAIKFENIKSSFIANISHEFKTPINIIVSVVRLFIAIDKGEFKSISKEKYIDYLNMLKQNSYRLLRLVNNIVDTSKIENNFYKLRLGNYNIIKLVEDITMSISNYFSENNRKIIFDTDEEEVILCCDPDKIEKVILNLLSNALKFSEPGSDINLDISTNFEENKVYISVKNKGDLISEEYANKIFGQFIQGENILSRRAEGSGIGLYLAKHFMQMHKGDIWINLDNKECTEFILSMPIDVIYKEESIHEEVYNIDENKIIEKCNIEFSDIYE